jgi:YD repeat-containing protein
MEKADIFLATTIFGGADLTKSLDDTNPAIDAGALPPRDAVEKFFEKAAFDQALEKSGGPLAPDLSWDEPLTAPLEKSFTNPLRFTKGSIGQKLGIVRVERKVDAEGETWSYAYNTAGELVDARVIESH